MQPTLQVHIGFSANNIKFMLSLHSVALAALLLAHISSWQRLVLLLLVLASAIWHLSKPQQISQLIYLPNSGWRCQHHSGKYSAWYELQRSLLWRPMAIVYLAHEAEKIALIIWRDAVTETDFRRLSVVLTDVRTYRQ